MSTQNTSAITDSYTEKNDPTERAVYDAAVSFLEYADRGATLEDIKEYVENSRVWSTEISAGQVCRILEEGEDISVGVTGIFSDDMEVQPAYYLDR